MFFNEGAGDGWLGFGGRYAFIVENVLGAYAALSNALPSAPVTADNAIIAWDRGWRGYEHNSQLATGLWGMNIVEPEQWHRLGQLNEEGVFFERGE